MNPDKAFTFKQQWLLIFLLPKHISVLSAKFKEMGLTNLINHKTKFKKLKLNMYDLLRMSFKHIGKFKTELNTIKPIRINLAVDFPACQFNNPTKVENRHNAVAHWISKDKLCY